MRTATKELRLNPRVWKKDANGNKRAPIEPAHVEKRMKAVTKELRLLPLMWKKDEGGNKRALIVTAHVEKG